jgi:formate dehydrogenase major subunit
VQIRTGTDIAFLGGLIRYAIENNRIARDYLINYTNAAFLIKDGFKLPEDGLFSGFDAATGSYDKSTWNYEDAGHGQGAPTALPASVAFDLTLRHPRSVFQLLKQHYSRYTPEMVERISGVPQAEFLKAADLFTSIRKDGDVKKAGTIIYAVGWTQHSSGTQTIRTAAMLQLLLGNLGRAGGGVNALRGHSNIQGATDMAGIYDILPGYLKMPAPADATFKAYLDRTTPTVSKPGSWDSYNYWSNTPRFAVSFQKAMYGDAATKENDWAFHYLPKIDRKYSWAEIWDDMYKGEIKGLFAFGMNGVQIGPNSHKNIQALKKADWLVVCEIYPDETSEFWKSPGITTDEMKQIHTTVYRLPGAGFAEKDGTFVNSARWLQWKSAALPPPGAAKLDQEILARIFLKVRELYQKEGGKFPDPILHATWGYTDPHNPSLAEVAREINGRALADVTDPATNTTIKAGQQLPGFAFLRDDGSTSSGNWLYCGSWTEAGAMIQRRGTDDPSGLGIYPNWGWSWPANRRVMYNRASCDLNGNPWDPDRRQVWWNEAQKRWVGVDVPDFKADSAPKDHMGPFIMNPDGIGRLFVPLAGLADGPFPEHYEPTESPVDNPLHPKQSHNPIAKRFKSDLDKIGTTAEGYNIVCTTYRLTEHYHYWTKNNPMNVQLVPEPFIEIPAELANDLGLRGGEKIKVTSARGQYIAKAMVTRRIKGMMIDGKKTYQIGIPIHWGFRGIAEDDGRTSLTGANLLSPAVTDPNANTPEFKGFLVKVEKA